MILKTPKVEADEKQKYFLRKNKMRSLINLPVWAALASESDGDINNWFEMKLDWSN